MAEQSIDDPFRDEIPSREPFNATHVLEGIIGPLRPRDEGDDPQPEPAEVQCGVCHKRFRANAAWFSAKWVYPSLCANCADGNKLPLGFLNECQRAPIRPMHCTNCGISRNVEPVLRNNVWEYVFVCSHCGYRSVTLYRIRRLCAGCNEAFNVHERRPKRYCTKCDKDRKTAYTT